jgi:gluconolactonase
MCMPGEGEAYAGWYFRRDLRCNIIAERIRQIKSLSRKLRGPAEKIPPSNLALFRSTFVTMNWTLILVISLLQLAAAPQPARPLDGIPNVVAKGETVQLVKEGFAFTEGPVPTSDGGLYFSDLLTSDRIHHLSPNGEITVLREHANTAGGLALNRAGELFAVETDGKRVSKFVNGKVTVVTEGSPEKPLLAPNDLILDSKGGVYFTDPGPRPVVAGRIVYVYYLAPGAKQPFMLDDKIVRPNGIILTTDGKTLLVDDTVGETIFAYDVQADGTVKKRRVFTKLHDIPSGQNSGGDGMALDPTTVFMWPRSLAFRFSIRLAAISGPFPCLANHRTSHSPDPERRHFSSPRAKDSIRFACLRKGRAGLGNDRLLERSLGGIPIRKGEVGTSKNLAPREGYRIAFSVLVTRRFAYPSPFRRGI